MMFFIYIFLFIYSCSSSIEAAKYLSRNKDGVYKFIKADPAEDLYKAQPIGSINAYGPLERNPYVLKTVKDAALKYRVDSALIMAIIKAESNFKNNAVSPAGAEGIMQIMPGTAIQYGVINTFDFRESIYGGTRYLRYLLNMFMGNVQLAVAAYNSGEGAVFRFGTIPPYDETQNYVKKVINYYNIYSYKKFKDAAERKNLIGNREKVDSISKEKKEFKNIRGTRKIASINFEQTYSEKETEKRESF